MQTARIISYMKESWGTSTFYSTESLEIDNSALVTTESEVIKVMSKMQTIGEEEPIRTRSSSLEKCLNYFTSALFATAMEGSMTKLRILMECSNELRIIKISSEMKKLKAIKYDVKLITCTDGLEDIDTNNLGCEQYKINKLHADRNYAAETILSTYIDLCSNRRYDSFKLAINKLLDSDHYRIFIQDEHIKRKKLRQELHKQLRQRRNHIKSVIYETNLIIEKLQLQVGDSDIYANCRTRYIEKWENARTEQHNQSINDIDTISAENVEYYKRKTELEQRVHSEIDVLNNILISETLEKTEIWMAKYDRDIEKIDLKIRLKKTEYQDTLEKNRRLERTIEAHDIAIKDWCAFKEIRENARLYREKMNKSATIVQSWWRGLLVRRQLGPYTVAKDPKGHKGRK